MYQLGEGVIGGFSNKSKQKVAFIHEFFDFFKTAKNNTTLFNITTVCLKYRQKRTSHYKYYQKTLFIQNYDCKLTCRCLRHIAEVLQFFRLEVI